VVANVNGEEVTERDLSFAESEISSVLAGVPEESRRRMLAEYLIETNLMAEAAKKSGIPDSDEFKARMEYYRIRALRDAYFENFEKEARSSELEAEAQKLYEERIQSLPKQEEVHARHILVKTEEEAKNIKKELEGGGDFAELAKKNSLDRGGADGGDLGYFTSGQMVKPFDEAVFKMEKGKLSDPVKTQFGWHIIKLEDKRDRQAPSFDEVKDQITTSLIRAKLQSAVEDMRKSAKVEMIDPELKKAVEAENKPEAPAAPAQTEAPANAEDANKNETEKKN
jgi:peptidyl-prolyl cis-trans isomerase C